jgi:hypothetical protein
MTHVYFLIPPREPVARMSAGEIRNWECRQNEPRIRFAHAGYKSEGLPGADQTIRAMGLAALN